MRWRVLVELTGSDGCVSEAIVATGERVGDRPDSVGAVLRPGAADPVSQAPAGALAGRRTALRDLWPSAMLATLRARLEATASLDERLAIF